jgi:hypothetical protein
MAADDHERMVDPPAFMDGWVDVEQRGLREKPAQVDRS